MLHLLLPLVSLLAAGPSAAPPAFPDTPSGRHARAWFPAYNGGEAAMADFMHAHLSAAGLARRSVAERLELYHSMRDRLGALTAVQIEGGPPTALTVIAATDGGHRVQLTFECEEDAPHALAGVRVIDAPDEETTAAGGEPGAHEIGGGHAGMRRAVAQATSGPPMTRAQAVRAIHARVDSLARAQAFSGAVLVAHGDQVMLRDAWGMASREHRIRNTPTTRFNLGSINKAFTRIAIEQLAAAGKLTLDDTLSRWLTDYPQDKARRITLRQLLDHRGGTGDIFNARYQRMDHGQVRTLADWMDLIRDQPLAFEPGTREQYSNAGYVLLGAVIERASGEGYYDYVQRHIFDPAGMHDSGWFARDAGTPDLATGYTRGEDGRDAWHSNADGLPGRGSPAGGGYATLDDLLRFARAWRSGRLGVADPGGIGIAGGAPGINAALEISGDDVLVVLTNLDPPAAERVAAASRGYLARAAGGTGARLETRVGGEPHAMHVHAGGEHPEHTAVPEGGVEVPMHFSGHLPAVDVMVNGKGPYRFAIDTGAGGLARIDSSLAAELGLTRIGEVHAGDPSGRNLRVQPLMKLDTIELGGARFTGLTAVEQDFTERKLVGNAVGILGFGLFTDGLLTLDYPRQRVAFASGALPPANGDDVLVFHAERGIPTTTLRVAGIDVDADVDAGSMGGFSLPESLAATLPLASKPVVVGRGRTVSNTFEITSATLNGEVTLGGQRFDHPRVDFQPLFPMANVGSRILRDFAITFDQKNHRMRLQKTQADASRTSQ